MKQFGFPAHTQSLEFENRIGACSEKCYYNVFGSEPYIPEHRWTGADLAFLRTLPQLRRLTMCNVWLGKQALHAIADCEQLEYLALDRCDYDDRELPELRRLKRLKVLRFYDNYLMAKSRNDWINPKWIGEIKSLQEVQLLLARDPDVIGVALVLPGDCKLAIPISQFKVLARDSNYPAEAQSRLVTRSDEDLAVYTGY